MVEVSADASHQHEFNAGLLRTSLGFPEQKVTGNIEFTYVTSMKAEPIGESCSYSVYNARAGKPRAAEYRLYFASTELQATATASDILILVRPDDGFDLKGLIVSSGSELGRTLTAILEDDGVELNKRFRQISAAIKTADLTHLLAEAAEPLESLNSLEFVRLADSDFLMRALQSGKLPGTKAMAAQATLIVRKAGLSGGDPDEELHSLLRVETTLFRYLEQEIGQSALDRIGSSGRIDFNQAVALVMSQLQSRKSRRGHSLQHHFADILTRYHISFSPQCETEHGETPDFVIPGCKEYRDAAFPADRLRMVACKSTLKERWGQILKEAQRIPKKYVLTLDTGLTDDVIDRITKNQLVLFLPKPLLVEAYGGRSAAGWLRTVAELLSQLKAE
jgi:hypothetical protein